MLKKNTEHFELVNKLATLIERFGKNYEEKNLRRMIQFASEYPNIENVVTLSRNLSWSHFLVLITVKNLEAKRYYEKQEGEQLPIGLNYPQ